MKLTCYASGSTGNLYSLDDGQTRILIECGLSYKEMQRLTGHTLSKFDTCLLTHNHGDHAKGAWDLSEKGISIRASKGTLDYIGMTHLSKDIVCPGIEFSVGTFDVLPFEVEHDAEEPLGYFIRSNVDGESLLFATDTFFLRPLFPNVTIMAIECNYSSDLIPSNCSRQDRLFSSHMSLKQCIATLKANDLSKCREIHLLHLSSDHSDEERFIREVQEATGIPTFAAPAYSRKVAIQTAYYPTGTDGVCGSCYGKDEDCALCETIGKATPVL